MESNDHPTTYRALSFDERKENVAADKAKARGPKLTMDLGDPVETNVAIAPRTVLQNNTKLLLFSAYCEIWHCSVSRRLPSGLRTSSLERDQARAYVAGIL